MIVSSRPWFYHVNDHLYRYHSEQLTNYVNDLMQHRDLDRSMDLTVTRSSRDDHSSVLQLQRVRWECDPPLRPLYWRTGDSGTALAVAPDPGGGLTLQPQAHVAFDTYFNAFFERQWRSYTNVRRVRLDLDLAGRAVLRVWRWALEGEPWLLYETVASGATSIDIPPPGPNFRQSGLVWFEISALDAPVTLRGGSWSTPGPAARRSSLGLVICTMNREPELGAVLTAIADDPGLEDVVGRVTVVNQGRAGLYRRLPAVALRLGTRLDVLEQANYGGAGGFGRGMLEALDDPAVTHVCVLDDDVRLDPESLLRMAAFFSMARSDVALGGHMLDAVEPTKLYEAGARVQPSGIIRPLRPASDLTDPDALKELLDTPACHFNGWWLFGVEKSVIGRLGLPLPCFIRGDDVEFGLRLNRAGVATVGLPGVAIWHEPFYLKIGGWQLYYEIRNAFIAMALHQGFAPRHVALVAFKQVMTYLLTFRYGSAALVIRGIQDFCRGPLLLEAAPAALHAEIVALRAGYAEQRTRATDVLADAVVLDSPRWTPGFIIRFARAILRNWVMPTRPAAPPQRLDAGDLTWFRVVGSDCLAIDTYWDAELPIYRRDRPAFRSLFRAGLEASVALWRSADALRSDWRRAAPTLTSETFWRGYLDLPDTAERRTG